MLKSLLQLTCGSLLLLARTSYGQVMPMPRYTSPPPDINWNRPMWYGNNPDVRQGSGSYQLPDGSWHPALSMSFNGLKLVVKGEGKEKTLRLLATQVNQFEIEQDTFRAVRTLPVELVNSSDFAEGLFNQQGVQVWRLLGTADYLLQLPRLPLDLMPMRKTEFKKLLLPLVDGCPALTAGIADGTFGPRDIMSIVRRYVDCRAGVPAASK